MLDKKGGNIYCGQVVKELRSRTTTDYYSGGMGTGRGVNGCSRERRERKKQKQSSHENAGEKPITL